MSGSYGTDSTLTQVSVVAGDSTATLSANPSRIIATIFNDGAATIYLSYGATCSTTVHSVQIGPQGYLEIPGRYTGAVTHRGSSATGTLRCTEIS